MLDGGNPPQSKSNNGGNGLGGGLRTMCVRMCDGYYWPVTHDAARNRFNRDAKVCVSSCDSEARLFYMPVAGDAKDMVDLKGASYSKLPGAFRYRKELVADCRCKPQAWEDDAIDRHRAFAAAKAGRLAALTNDAAASPKSAPPKAANGEQEALNDRMDLAGAELDSSATARTSNMTVADAAAAQLAAVSADRQQTKRIADRTTQPRKMVSLGGVPYRVENRNGGPPRVVYIQGGTAPPGGYPPHRYPVAQQRPGYPPRYYYR